MRLTDKYIKIAQRASLLGASFMLATSSTALIITPQASAQQLFDAGVGASVARDLVNQNTQGLHKENKGAGKNGPGSAKIQKNGKNGTSSYVDGSGSEQSIEFTHPDEKQRPAIIFVHGGGWRADDGNYDQAFRDRAGEKGFASFRLKYRLMPNAINANYNDIMNAVEHIRNNAKEYNVDPARLLIWGDSAGGSLAVRVAASGKSGLAGLVGWSAPTNAIRSMFHSPQSLAIGLDHSTCFNTQFTEIFTDIAEIYRGQEYLFQDPSKLLNMSTDELTKFAESTLKAINLFEEKKPFDQLKQGLGEWGVDVDRLTNLYSSARDSSKQLDKAVTELGSSSANTANSNADKAVKEEAKQENVPVANSDLQAFKDSLTRAADTLAQTGDDSEITQSVQSELRRIVNELPANPGEEGKLTLEQAKSQVEEMSNSLKQAADSSDPNDKNSLLHQLIESTEKQPEKRAKEPVDEKETMRAYTSMLNDQDASKLNDALGAINTLNSREDLTPEQRKRLEPLNKTASDASSALNKNSSNFLSAGNGETQNKLVNKVAECADNLIQLSPALFADPKTPPVFMVNASHETITPPQDAYEMRDKVRSFGTRGEVLILEGDNHMGYDERAVEPSFGFGQSLLHPEPVGQ